MVSLGSQAVVAWTLMVVVALAVTAHATSVTNGYPYVMVVAKPATIDTVWSDDSMRASIAQWFSFRYPPLNGLTAAGVEIHDEMINPTGDGYNTLSITLDSTRYDNGFVYTYLNNMIPSLVLNGVMGTNVSVANASLVENPSSYVMINFDTLSTQYNGSWSSPIKVTLSFSPQVGTNVVIGFNTTTASDVIVDPWPLVIAFPAVSTTFRLLSKVPKTYTMSCSVVGGTDTSIPFRYVDLGCRNLPWKNSYLENVTITPPAANIPFFANQPTESFTIMIPQSFLYPNPRVVVAIRANPPSLFLSSTSIALTQRGVMYSFFCSGAIGTYTLSYSIGPPTNTQNQNNNYFYSPTVTHTVVIQPLLNVSTASIPDAFMAALPASSQYGGAFSVPVALHIQRSPKRSLTVTIDCENGESSPASLVFAPGGTTTLLYRLRALSTGIKSVRYTLSGLSAGDYATPNVRRWSVHGPNPHCVALHDKVTCFSTNGCQWNEMKSMCTNHTLPILLSRTEQMFDGERSKNISFTLPTPVQRQLTITFIAADRLMFFPSTITLHAGATGANFTVLPTLGYKEDLVRQPYYFQLSDLDCNTYTQQDASILIRAKIICNVAYPWSFYIGTISGEYDLTCETDPEDDVNFTPVAVGQTAITFQLVPPLTTNNRSLLMLPGSSSVKFYTRSSNSPAVGNFTISFIIAGTNAPRYAPISPVPVRVLPLGFLNVPPHFRITEKTMSPLYSVDISIPPDEVVYVSIQVFNASTNTTVSSSDVTVMPTNLTFNDTMRNTIQVYGKTPGAYYFRFNISGLIANYFNLPALAPFEIYPRFDGSAFTSRLGLGFMPVSRCRVNVGRNSEFFKGQNAPDGLSRFCETYRPVEANSTYNCSDLLTELDCRDALRNTGNLCVWNISSCILLAELQGNVTDVAYGSGFTLLLTKNFTVFSIGQKLYGQLGHQHNYAAQVPIRDNITAIVAGNSHSLALSQSGYVYAWGNNNQGQLGIGSNTQEIQTPVKMTFPKGENITCISTGSLHSGAVSLSGIAYVWGSNQFGQLANLGTFHTIARTPVAIGRDKLDGDSAIAIQCGEYHTMVATGLAAYTFGLNAQGQLGRPGYDEYVPAKPILWNPSRFVPMPNYPSYVTGQSNCPNNNN